MPDRDRPGIALLYCHILPAGEDTQQRFHDPSGSTAQIMGILSVDFHLIPGFREFPINYHLFGSH